MTEHANVVVVTMITFYILFMMMNANISETIKLQLPTYITQKLQTTIKGSYPLPFQKVKEN
jgi:hypothetical protein